MAPHLTHVSELRCRLGEGPLWDPDRCRLLVTDLHVGAVSELDLQLHAVGSLQFDRPATAMTRQQDGSLLIFHDRGDITHVTTAGHTLLTAVLTEEREGLCNDVIADAQGRVLCGTQPIGSRPGRLYIIERNLRTRVLLDDIIEPNGMGFSRDGRTLYFTDSGAQTISSFDYDSGSGSIANRQVLFRAADQVFPDGLTVDAAGFLWSAQWNGACVLRLDPAGNVALKVPVPAMRVTSVAFGGPRYDQLFVTSAAGNGSALDAADLAPGATDGAVFCFEGCGTGSAEYCSRLMV